MQPNQPYSGAPQNTQPPQNQQPPQYAQQQPYQQAGPTGALRLKLSYPPLAWTYAVLSPQVTLNGQRVPARWGRNEYPMPAGQHQVHVQIPYLFPVGKADAAIPVHAGQPTDAEYAAPWITFMGGQLGPSPQKSRGSGSCSASWPRSSS